MKNQLTHFTRLLPAPTIRTSLSAWFKLSIYAGLVILFILNLAIRFPKSYTNLITKTTYNHILLANNFFVQGKLNLAKAELHKIKNPTNTEVLGVMTTELSPLSSWERENEKLNSQLAYWKEVSSNYPEYRDAYLAIAQLGYLLRKPEMVSENLRKAAMLDPNGISVKMLERITK